jgi:hypothetical protein
MNLMMNNEEFERKMVFIVNQQAKFAVDIDLLHEAQARTEQNLDRLGDRVTAMGDRVIALTDVVTRIEEVVIRLAYVTNEGFKQLIGKVDAVVDSQIRTDDTLKALQKRTDEKFQELAASQARTDEIFHELAASQARTEETLRKFIRGLSNGRNNN